MWIKGKLDVINDTNDKNPSIEDIINDEWKKNKSKDRKY
jgi:hypothetical protein